MIIENYEFFFAFLGLAFLGLAVLPIYLRKSYVSLPMIYILIGFIISLVWNKLPRFDPIQHNLIIEKVTEFTVIISLMSAGIKIDKPLKWKTWKPTIRLLIITMPLFILLITFISNLWMGLSYGAAVLLGAVLSPTDPVLASDVQVSNPQSGKNDSLVKFSLTSEAGLNDGLAFPFVYLAGFILMKGFSFDIIFSWFTYEFLYKIIVGVIVGYICGKSIGHFLFGIKKNHKFQDGFVAVAITIFTYGVAEIVDSYGFISVFVAAYFFRHTEISHDYHRELHDFANQIEKLLVCILLIFFGLAIGHGILNYLTIQSVIIGLLILFVLRPLLGYISLYNTSLNKKEKLIISFLGIKGIGSFYYLAFGLEHFDFGELDVHMIWALVSFVILVSVIIHGVTAPLLIKKHEKIILNSNN